MKKIIFYSLALALVLQSCSKDDEEIEKMQTLQVDLNSIGMIQYEEGSGDSIDYPIVLSKALGQTTVFTFSIKGEKSSELFKKTSYDVTIDKGKNKGNLIIELKSSESILDKDKNFEIELTKTNNKNLSSKLKGRVMFKVTVPKYFKGLSKDQKKVLKEIKAKGSDISLWIGKIPVTVKIKSPAGGYAPFENAFDAQYEGYSMITLDDAATADNPVLKITENAFGLNEYFNFVFRKETLDNEPGNNSFKGMPNEKMLYEAMGEDNKRKWENDEIPFNVKIDSLVFNEDKTVTFYKKDGAYGPYEDFYEIFNDKDKTGNYDMITAPNFTYDFPLWDELFQKANTDKTTKYDDGSGIMLTLEEIMGQGGVLYPDAFLVNSQIEKDEYSWTGNGIWKKATSSYDAKTGELKFTFPFDHSNSGDYTIIEVTYTSPYIK